MQDVLAANARCSVGKVCAEMAWQQAQLHTHMATNRKKKIGKAEREGGRRERAGAGIGRQAGMEGGRSQDAEN